VRKRGAVSSITSLLLLGQLSAWMAQSGCVQYTGPFLACGKNIKGNLSVRGSAFSSVCVLLRVVRAPHKQNMLLRPGLV